MSLFGGSKSTNAQQSPAYTQMQLQSSVYGVVVPVIYGRTRVGWNLGDYVNFKQISTPNASSSSGGKGGIVGGGGGGGKGGNQGSTISYTTSLLGILGEGPITSIPSSWVSQTQNSGSPGFDLFTGSIAQTPWLYLTDNYPSHALTYSGIAYMGGENYDLGSSANLPNINWEVVAILSGTAPGSYGGGGDADPSQIIPDMLSNAQYGIGFPANRVGQLNSNSENYTIPTTPFQITVTNAINFLFNINVVIAGVSLTCVASSPASGQYSYTSGGVYTFNSAQAGQSVSIRYASISVMTNYKNFCLASGLWISPAFTDQSEMASLLADLALFTFSEVVWSCGVLQLIPRGTQQVIGNSYTFTPNTTPIFNLGIDDFMSNSSPMGTSAGSSDDPVLVSRSRVSDQINSVKMEILDRANQYAPAVVEASDQGLIQKYGRRGGTSKSAHAFADLNAGNVSVQLQLQDEYIRNHYSFQLDERYCVLDPMDLVTLTDPQYPGLTLQGVRIQQISENDDGSLSFLAEEYPGNIGTVPSFNLNTGSGYVPDFNVTPGDVAVPAIFDVPVQLAQVIGLETWIGICSTNNNPNWGGADIYLSTDNATYDKIGTINGASRMGSLSALFPSGSDPDTVNTLKVNLSISGGELQAGSLSDANNNTTLCFVDGEYISYEQCTLTTTFNYDLGKHGATAGLLRRGQWGSTISSHASGSLFVRLDDGVFKIPYSKTDMGRTIWIKCVSFNIYGGGYQSIGSVTAYSHVIGGPPTVYAPSSLSVTAALKGLQLRWVNAPNVGVAAVEIWRSTTSAFGAATHIDDAAAYDTTYNDQTTASSTQYWYWIRCRDIAGNVSGYTPSTGGAGATNTPLQVATADIGAGAVTGPKIAAGAVDSLKFAAGIVPVQVVATLPVSANEGDQAVLTTTGKLYRYHSGAWTSAVDGADLSAYSVIGSKIAIADTTNICTNPDWVDGNGVPSNDGWTCAGPVDASAAYSSNGWPNRWVGNASTRDTNFGQPFPCSTQETYYISAWISNPSANSMSLGMQFYDADMNTLTWIAATTVPAGAGGGFAIQIVGQATSPSGARYGRIWIQQGATSGFGNCFFTHVVVRKASSAELLVDGSITASKMTVNSIVAGTIAVGAINASALIVNNILITDQLVNGAVTNSVAASVGGGNFLSIGLTTHNPFSGGVFVLASGQTIGTNTTVSLSNLSTGHVFGAYTIGPSLGGFCIVGFDSSLAGGTTYTYNVQCFSNSMNVTIYATEFKK